jgi:hypothetical protein
MHILQLDEELREHFMQDFYIKLNTQITDDGNIIICLEEPSEDNYHKYVDAITKYLDDEMIEDYNIDGDYEGIIEIWAT